MNHDNRYTFTPEELEELAQAYLDCRLTKLQEKELELVLMSCDVSSPVIDDARETMAVATAIGKPAPRKAERRLPAAIRWMRWGAAAACLAFVATFAVRMHHDASADRTMAVVVYEDGRRLTGDEAMRKAMETQASCMAMLETTLSNAQAINNESMKLLNNTIR